MNKNTQWLKLLPAAAVFAAVCVTCYQTDKTPAEATQVENNNIMSTSEIKKMLNYTAVIQPVVLLPKQIKLPKKRQQQKRPVRSKQELRKIPLPALLHPAVQAVEQVLQ